MNRTPIAIIALLLLTSVCIGLGLFTFSYGNGLSYLSSDPKACANCHIMQEQYDSWQHSSHKNVAGCNDCHTPDHPIWKWVTKADNGFFHSLAFTFGGFHEPIEIKPRNHRVTLGTCISCHEGAVHQMNMNDEELKDVNCIRCHSSVGHGLR